MAFLGWEVTIFGISKAKQQPRQADSWLQKMGQFGFSGRTGNKLTREVLAVEKFGFMSYVSHSFNRCTIDSINQIYFYLVL